MDKYWKNFVGLLRIQRGERNIAIAISIFFLLFYVFFQSHSVYGGDGGDLVSAALVRGVAHPPGYPLYTFIAWILTKIPFATVAWRVTLLSSIPAAISLGIFYLLSSRLTANKMASVLATATLGFSYLFWLYASVPEVFGLHLLFLTAISFILYSYHQSGEKQLLYALSLVFGLSLTHHHTILFLVPAILYVIFPRLRSRQITLRQLGICVGLGILGLLPYIYVIWAAAASPPVNWENPVTVNGFYRLVTRALYGTFKSGTGFGADPFERVYQLQLYIETLLIDLTRLGLILAVLGAFAQFKKQKRHFFVTCLAFIFLGPFFIFYTGFPVSLNFYLGITERFVLSSYIFLALWIAFGISFSSELIARLLRRYVPRKSLGLTVTLLFALYPLLLLYTNYGKITPLKFDFTAERLGEDILRTAESNGLIFLLDDTSLFNTEYVYHIKNNDLIAGKKLIQLGTLGQPFYQTVLKAAYPQIDFSETATTSAFPAIVERYHSTLPIYTNLRTDVGDDFVWVQIGLLKKLYSKNDSISNADYIRLNRELFSSYQDPLSGALKEYLHVTLSDTARVYGHARREVGETLFKVKEYAEAEIYLAEAVRLISDTPEIRLSLAQTLLLQNKCAETFAVLKEQRQLFPFIYEADRLFALFYQQCENNPQKAAEHDELYRTNLKNSQTTLETF